MKQQDKVTHIILNSQVLLDRLHDLKANGYFKQSLKGKTNLFLRELEKVEKQYFDQFFDKKEESTQVVYDVYDDYISQIASVPIWDMENIANIIKAYNKDPKSIEGIVKKINND